MAARKKKKNVKVVEAEIVGDVKEEIMVPMEVEKREDKMLIWFFVVVGVVFAAVLIPFFWTESSKAFEYGEVSWTVEDYEELRIFHGRFLSLTDGSLNEPNLFYNIFLRTDPRSNDVEVSGKLNSFKYGGIVSLSPEADSCRGDLARVMLDLGAFLKQGLGVGMVESASSDENVANETGKKFVNCDNVLDRTVVIVEIGEGGVAQDEENLNCYTIYAKDCEDSKTVEKFITQTIVDFRELYPIEK